MIIYSDEIPEDLTSLEVLSIYNGLDCALTLEVFDVIKNQLDANTSKIYAFEKALQGPVMDMQLRGIRVDRGEIRRNLKALDAEYEKFNRWLTQLSFAAWDRPLNPESPKQLSDLFYGVMRLPEQRARVGKEWKPSTNREALEKLAEYPTATILVRVILALRDIQGLKETLTRGVDNDGRMRCSYGIAGTTTGRFSSSKNIFRSGGNIQNITDDLRGIFIPDPGMKLAYIDLEQAESRAVGLIAKAVTGQDTYLKSCESGDLHTTVCRMVWPNLPWTDDPKKNRAIADQSFYRNFTYRDMAKRAGHATNYLGQPGVIATALKIPRSFAESFQEAYFLAFTEIKLWHDYIKETLVSLGIFITPFGRVRQFFGRKTERSTQNKATAYAPQSLVADMLNSGMLDFFRKTYAGLPAQLLSQVHDAILIQYPIEHEAEVIREAKSSLERCLPGTDFSIPADVAVGWNFRKFSPKENPFGLKKYKTSDDRLPPHWANLTQTSWEELLDAPL